MKLTERHGINRNHYLYRLLEDECRKANNLYNRAMFVIRQHYFHLIGKQYIEDISDSSKIYLDYIEVNKLLKTRNDFDYRQLNTNTSQAILRLVDQDFKSFFALLKIKQQGKYDKPVNIPRYKKSGGKSICIYNISNLSCRNRTIRFPKTKIDFSKFLNLDNAKQIRVIPKGDEFILELVYDKEEKEQKIDNNRYASLDPGLDNFATIVSNVSNPYIINGRKIKSENRYWNKKVSKLKSELKNCNNLYTSKKLRQLNRKRANKIDWFLHNTSRYIVNQLVSNNINTIIVGYNREWKQDINIGDKNNQNFVCIPHSRFFSMLKYKCRLEGIRYIEQEESYTSKSSFLDDDFIPTYRIDDNKFAPSGYRKFRGLYISKNRTKLNADVNGAYNIMRKNLKVSSKTIIGQRSIGLVIGPAIVNINVNL